MGLSKKVKKLAIIDACVDTPEEIILAADLVPHRLFGDPSLPHSAADEHVPPTHCVWTRNILEQGLRGLPGDIAGLLSIHGCDCTNRQFDIWLDSVKADFMYFLNSPLKRNNTALKFFSEDLKEFALQLEEYFKVEITDEKLHESIVLMNKIRETLKTISEFRNKMILKYSELHELLKLVLTSDKSQALKICEDKLEELKTRDSFSESHLKRILLTGSVLDDTSFIKQLENTGFHIVIDDLCLGTHYFWNTIEESGDPIKAIAQYHLEKPIYSTKVPSHARYEYMKTLIDAYSVEGVVNIAQKFCESVLYDHPFLKTKFKELNIPYLFVEKEYNREAYKQLSTRFDAFAEII
ncbi:MAG: putative 2-hydroxyglutaryl-CoA dehydratase D-component [Promethearchaeota archaeon]|nr:MAG: putative 2-hydroxyglutaryl-CoA dehydratase D-component [Candidatus Lokiarchaeota archaeon]